MGVTEDTPNENERMKRRLRGKPTIIILAEIKPDGFLGSGGEGGSVGKWSNKDDEMSRDL